MINYVTVESPTSSSCLLVGGPIKSSKAQKTMHHQQQDEEAAADCPLDVPLLLGGRKSLGYFNATVAIFTLYLSRLKPRKKHADKEEIYLPLS